MRLDTAKAYAAERGWTVEEARGIVWIDVPADELPGFFEAMQEAGFNYLANVIGIDYSTYPEARPERFAVLYELVSIKGWKDGDGSRFFARVWVSERDPALPSAVPFYESANFFEREIFDLLGIKFEGHPDLRKILTPEDLEGHPLRKDYPLGETPTLFRDGRYIDPAQFRASLTGQDVGLTGRIGGARRGYAEFYEDVKRAAAADGEDV
ncbi:NADH-quinone oxidoreductase subunit C [Oceanithermus sp.]|uniref:NADH-quinone oxidoreductase subunit C n=1 Tax=Oceanithermus sp. TaxID=2268145 RepID=UPI0025E659C2|nr:NADH-quinone oxidoreductase subunit C [Oceanithermus sp.]